MTSDTAWKTERTFPFSATPRKTNVTLENQPFEDISPIKNGDVPLSYSLIPDGASIRL